MFERNSSSCLCERAKTPESALTLKLLAEIELPKSLHAINGSSSKWQTLTIIQQTLGTELDFLSKLFSFIFL